MVERCNVRFINYKCKLDDLTNEDVVLKEIGRVWVNILKTKNVKFDDTILSIADETESESDEESDSSYESTAPVGTTSGDAENPSTAAKDMDLTLNEQIHDEIAELGGQVETEATSSGMVTRSIAQQAGGVEIFQSLPNQGGSLIAIDTPKTAKQALQSQEKDLWQAAMEAELNSQAKYKTWTVVDRPKGAKVIKNRWLFVRKMKLGEETVYKARLVACGYSQIHQVDYFETYAPVISLTGVRLIFFLAHMFDLVLHVFDVKTAFLNSQVDEELFMSMPEGLETLPGKVCKLNKSIHGLKQSPKCWHDLISGKLIEFGLQKSEADSCIFYEQGKLIVELYVDDGLVAAKYDGICRTLVRCNLQCRTLSVYALLK